MEVQWNLDITNLYITKSPVWRTIFFIPVTAKWMKKNLDITKPRSSEQILPVPWPFVMLRFHSTNWGHSFYVSYWRRHRRFYIIGAKEGQGQYLHCSVVLSVSTVMVITSATSRSTVKRSTDFPWSIKKTPVKAKQTTTCWMLAWKYTVQYSALVET